MWPPVSVVLFPASTLRFSSRKGGVANQPKLATAVSGSTSTRSMKTRLERLESRAEFCVLHVVPAPVFPVGQSAFEEVRVFRESLYLTIFETKVVVASRPVDSYFGLESHSTKSVVSDINLYAGDCASGTGIRYGVGTISHQLEPVIPLHS